jgi:hypothetical protein
VVNAAHASQLALAAQIAVAAVFLGAAYAKVRDRAAVRSTLLLLGVPRSLIKVGAAAVLASEAGVGFAVLSGVDPWLSGLGATVLSAGLVAISLYALSRREAVPCSCFGGSERYLGRETLVLSMPMLVASAATVAVFDRGGTHVAPSQFLTPATIAVVGIALYRWSLVFPALWRARLQRRVLERELVASYKMHETARGL